MLSALKSILTEHPVALILLSVSWILIYFSLRGLETLVRKLLVESLFSVRVWLGRRRLNIVRRRSEILGGVKPITGIEPLPSDVGKLYSSLNEEASRIRQGVHWVNRILPERLVDEEVKSGVRRHLAVLESDHALLRAISTDGWVSESGIITFVGNPRNDPTDSFNLLLRILRYGNPSLRQIALFHVKNTINNADQLRQFDSVVSGWSGPDRQAARRVTQEVGERLTTRGA